MLSDPREQLRDMELRMQRTANPVRYNQLMCQRIHDRAVRVTLPKLSLPEMSKLKHHLRDFRRMDGDDLRIKFLNLRNCFLILDKFEEDADVREKIRPILAWLGEYKYVFDLIIESQGQKDSPLLDKALIILHLDITEFNILYSHMLIESEMNPSDFAPIEVTAPEPEPEAAEPPSTAYEAEAERPDQGYDDYPDPDLGPDIDHEPEPDDDLTLSDDWEEPL